MNAMKYNRMCRGCGAVVCRAGGGASDDAGRSRREVRRAEQKPRGLSPQHRGLSPPAPCTGDSPLLHPLLHHFPFRPDFRHPSPARSGRRDKRSPADAVVRVGPFLRLTAPAAPRLIPSCRPVPLQRGRHPRPCALAARRSPSRAAPRPLRRPPPRLRPVEAPEEVDRPPAGRRGEAPRQPRRHLLGELPPAGDERR